MYQPQMTAPGDVVRARNPFKGPGSAAAGFSPLVSFAFWKEERVEVGKGWG